ncbi:hypothetical protein J3459_006428 [Metarhizium acridum]|nr:hypothetical protein J3459_006428 [Metarhizium acridum]
MQAAPYTLRRAPARLCKLRHRRTHMCVPPGQGPALAEEGVIATAFADSYRWPESVDYGVEFKRCPDTTYAQ